LDSWKICTRMKRVTPREAKNFVFARCRNVTEDMVEPIDKLCDEVMTVRAFCYLGDRMNASGGCEAGMPVTSSFGDFVMVTSSPGFW